MARTSTAATSKAKPNGAAAGVDPAREAALQERIFAEMEAAVAAGDPELAERWGRSWERLIKVSAGRQRLEDRATDEKLTSEELAAMADKLRAKRRRSGSPK